MVTRELAYDPIFDAQKHYRKLLDSMARPGKINQLDDVSIKPPGGWSKAAMFIGFALLNREVSFWVNPDDQELSQYVQHQTSARVCEVEHAADFVFLQGEVSCAHFPEWKLGTLAYPEESATLIIQLRGLSLTPMRDAIALHLKGPGVLGTKVVYVTGVWPTYLELLQKVNAEYPLGVDVFFVDQDDQFIGLPRSNKFSWTTTN